MTQSDVAEILGSIGARQVSRHEGFQATPSIFAAIAYQVIFRADVSELLPGLFEAVRDGVEQRLAEFEHKLQQSTAKGPEAENIARKLVWIEERRNQGMT